MLIKQHASIPRNRSLANLFFRAGYIESWGRGTIDIAQECKDYGLPAPTFNEQFGGFSVGFNQPDQVTAQDTAQIKQLLSIVNGELTRDELQEALAIKHREYFWSTHIKPALEAGLIEMTLPDKPNSKNQKYRLTTKGKLCLKGQR